MLICRSATVFENIKATRNLPKKKTKQNKSQVKEEFDRNKELVDRS